MNIREDKRESIKYYAFLTIAKLFFIAVAFINPDIKTIILLIIGVIFEGWAEKTDRKIAQSRPQDLKEGVNYIFCGADPKNQILFLEEHVHDEILVHATNINHTNDSSLIGLNSQYERVVTEIYDYDKPGIFYGVVFSEDLKIGEIVIKHEIEKDYVGIIRLDNFNKGVA